MSMNYLSVFSTTSSLFGLVAIGYLAGKLHSVTRESIASFVIFYVVPVVVFLGAYKLHIDSSLLIVPACSLFLALLWGSIFRKLGRRFHDDGTEALIAYSAASSNSGNFGLPLCVAVCGEAALPYVILYIMGLIVFEGTLGVYIFARTSLSPMKAVFRTLRMPALYAFFLGLAFNVFHISLATPIEKTLAMVRGGYPLLGMSLLGVGLSRADKSDFCVSLNFISVFSKLVIWPASMMALIYAEKTYFGLLPEIAHKVLIIESLTPAPANLLGYAVQFGVHPCRAAVAVVTGMVVATFSIPLMVPWLFDVLGKM